MVVLKLLFETNVRLVAATVGLSVFVALVDLLLVASIGPVADIVASGDLTIPSFLIPVFGDYSFESIYSPVLIFLGLVLFVATVKYINLRLNTYFAFSAGHQLVNALQDISAKMSLTDFHRFGKDSLFNMTYAKSNMLIYGVISPLVTSLSSFIQILLFLFFIVNFLDASSFVIFFVTSIFYAVFSIRIKGRLSYFSENISKYSGKSFSSLSGIMNSIREIKLRLWNEKFINKFRTYDKALRETQKEAFIVSQVPKLIVEHGLLITIIALIVVETQVNNSKIEASDLLQIFAFLGKLIVHIQIIFMSWSGFETNKALLKEAESILASPIEKNISRPSFEWETLKCKNISIVFGDRVVAKNLDISLKKGDKIGIIGKSGSGKTSLIELLMGLKPPVSGDVFFETADGKIVPTVKSRSSFSYAQQNPFFMNVGVHENITLNDFRLEDEAAVKNVLLEFELDELLDGQNIKRNSLSQIDVNTISGGQRQRISLARLFFQDRDVLVLDEVTSALDADTKNRVIDIIYKKFSDKTIIQISHDFQTLRYCTRVIEMKDGALIEVKL